MRYLLCLLLSACVIVPKYALPSNDSKPIVEEKIVYKTKTKTKEVKVRCKVLTVPQLVELPVAPTKSLKELSSDNHKAIDKILLTYIETLRKTIISNREIVNKHVKDYNAECQK